MPHNDCTSIDSSAFRSSRKPWPPMKACLSDQEATPQHDQALVG